MVLYLDVWRSGRYLAVRTGACKPPAGVHGISNWIKGLDSSFGRNPSGELSERPREVFRHLVDAFLTSGEPVGSRTLSQRLPIALSPASIRNVMADLETMGLLYAPHTSAGRVPTERGLRLFVDGMMEVGQLSADERGTIEARMSGSGRRLE